MRIFAWHSLNVHFPLLLSRWAYQGDTVFAGTGTDEVFSCRSRLMDRGVYIAPVNLPSYKDP